MDISADSERDDEAWINKALGIPAVPDSRRLPDSNIWLCIRFHLKLAFILLNVASALFRSEEPCLPLSLLLNGWLLWATCEAVYKNYPWRDPLNIWIWRLRMAVPCSDVLLTACAALLLLLFCTQVVVGCELPHPLAAASAGWLSCMVAWPLLRDSWRREEKVDCNQCGATRPSILTLPRTLGLALTTLRSPSMLVLLTGSVTASVATSFLHGWTRVAWAVCSGALVLSCLSVLCCHRLPEEAKRSFDEWGREETAYARQIENTLDNIKMMPGDGGDRLAVQVPLLQREAAILSVASCRSEARERGNRAAAEEPEALGHTPDRCGPYPAECCVS